MAKGDFYFPLFYQRLLTSTVGWTDEEFGAYLRLLIYQFDVGFIPGEIKELKKISKKAAKNWKFFAKKFIKIENGNYQNIVMAEIRDKIQNKKEVNRLNGKLGGRPAENYKPNGLEKQTERVTETKPIQEIIDKEIKRENGAVSFLEMFKRAADPKISDDQLLKEIEAFKKKYPNATTSKVALINAWVSNIDIQTPEVKKMVY